MGEGRRFCSRCDHELRAGSRFCGKCGQPASAGAAPASAARRPVRALAWLVAALVAVIVAGGAVSAFLLSRHSQDQSLVDSVGATFSSSPLSPGPGAVASTVTVMKSPPATPEQAARGLSALLAQSAADRDSIVNAVDGVNQCAPDLGQDLRTFQGAAASRRDLLSQLGSLPGRSALPAPMMQDLTGAWQASAQADQDFARWTQDEAAQGCTPNDQSDPNYQAADGPDNNATADKESFVSLWNPIASSYGLPNYQWNQL
jgi:hypothetical protein